MLWSFETDHDASRRVTAHQMRRQTHLVPVNRLAASPIPLGKVPTLRPVSHQSPDDTCLAPHEPALTHMKFLMMRWNELPSYPNPSSSPSRVLPVASARKFSAVLGTVLRSQRGVTPSMAGAGPGTMGQAEEECQVSVGVVDVLAVQPHHDSPERLTAVLDIKVDLGPSQYT